MTQFAAIHCLHRRRLRRRHRRRVGCLLVRGGRMALLGSMMERWDGFGLMMDGGMADDAATTIAVSPTPPGRGEESVGGTLRRHLRRRRRGWRRQ